MLFGVLAIFFAINSMMNIDKSERGKTSKNASISGTANDNHKSCCNLRILLCHTNVESCHEIFILLRQCSYQGKVYVFLTFFWRDFFSYLIFN